MASEVQGALREAQRAQELEDAGDVDGAADAFYRCCCQLELALDLALEKGSPLADVASTLVQTYTQRVAALRAKQEAAKGAAAHWVQLEQSGGEFASTNTQPGHAAARQAQQLLLHGSSVAVEPSALAAATAAARGQGALGLQHAFYDQPASAAEDDSGGVSSGASLELLRACQRSVSGGLDDVVGLESVKDELEEAIFLPLQHPHLFRGIRQPPRTFLLHGPPGTGKTLLVEKVAAEAGFMLLSISPSQVLSKWAGDSEKAVSGVFELARSFQPCLIFLDEVDSLGQSRGAGMDAGARRLLTELLIQFTRAAGDEGVYVFGATNRMQDCDPALLRRFVRRIEVPLPDAAQRAAFFAAMLARPELEADLAASDLAQLAAATAGYSGSDLADVCRTAALAPVRQLMQQQRGAGRKRRRGGALAALDCRSSCGGSEAGSAPDDGAGAAQPASSSAAAAAGSAADGRLQLRKLVMPDFQAALAVIRPAALDAAEPAASAVA